MFRTIVIAIRSFREIVCSVVSETYRLFIAIELSDPVKHVLISVQERLRRDSPPVKWVAPEAMHLTLQFLGETEARLLTRISTRLREALKNQPTFSLELGKFGAFPNLRHPSVLWVDISGATAVLNRMQASIVRELEPLGFPRETRPFRAHLTIGRVRREATSAQQQQLGATLAALPSLTTISWTIERVILFQSNLRPGGPRYTERDAVMLTL